MAESISTPRVTAQYLDGHTGKNVMIIGKVVQLRGDAAVIESQGNVSVMLNREAHLAPGNAVQIIGKVNPDLSIKVLTSKDLGNNVDFQLYQSVVEATHQFKSLFQCE